MDAPIACSLEAADVPARLAAWQDVVAQAVDRLPIDGGVRLVLDPAAPIGDVAALAAAEHDCCPFLTFTVTIDGRGRALEVTAPPEAGDLVATLLGPTS